MKILDIKKFNLNCKRVLIRSDLNVPIKNKKIQSDLRILASLPTIVYALKKNAITIVCSHFGRPTEGKFENKFSLFPVFKYLTKKVTFTKVHFIEDYLGKNIGYKPGELYILENVRFNVGENKNEKKLSKEYAKLCDIFVMDAFGSAHRKQASTCGIAKYVHKKCSGFLLKSEMKNLKKALKDPARPMISIVGGSKISTKFNILHHLLKISDAVIVGGGIANTFLATKYNIGRSLHEKNFIQQARVLAKNFNVIIPIDSRVSTNYNENAKATIKSVSSITEHEEIMDIGIKSEENIKRIIKKAKTVLWNGPLGVFEFKNFKNGTKVLAESIGSSEAFSIAGGGDTISAIEMFKVKEKISYISTGGGAFLKYLEGDSLPGIKCLYNSNN